MIASALVVAMWIAVALITRDRLYLLVAAGVICLEMSQHILCYRVLIRALIRKRQKGQRS